MDLLEPDLVERDGWLMPAAVDPKLFAQWQDEAVERLDLAMPYVKDRKSAVQAGGNLGIWPRMLAERYGFRVVETFEPDPINFRCLMTNTELAKVGVSIVCYPLALGRERGKVGWSRCSPDRPGWHRVAGGGFNGSGTVDVVTLDEVEPVYGCDLLALDVEGYELELLKGATRTVERYRPVVIFEDLGRSRFLNFRRRSTTAFGHRPGSVQRWLKARGYEKKAEVRNDEIWAPR